MVAAKHPRCRQAPIKGLRVVRDLEKLLLLGELLNRAGYIASVESDRKIASDWHPRPDVVGVLQMNEKYLTRPENVVVFEVLSEGDPIAEKCRHYSEIGIQQVFVFDPDAKTSCQCRMSNWQTVSPLPAQRSGRILESVSSKRRLPHP